MKKQNSKRYKNPLVFDVLLLLASGKQEVQRVLKRQMRGLPWRPMVSDKQINNTLDRLQRQGWVERKKIEDQIYYRLTQQGRIQKLAYELKTYKRRRSRLSTIAIFDIPEEKRSFRNGIRRLLKSMDFTMLQKSVFITPYILPDSFYEYLREMGILKYFLFFEGEMRMHI